MAYHGDAVLHPVLWMKLAFTALSLLRRNTQNIFLHASYCLCYVSAVPYIWHLLSDCLMANRYVSLFRNRK